MRWLERNDFLGVLPTGLGKSLVFQLFDIAAEIERRVRYGCFVVVTATSGLFRFSCPFQRASRNFKNFIGYYIL